MVAEVYGGISAIKAAFDIAKGLKDIDDATRRNAAVIELQEQILGAQAAQTSLIENIGDLKKEIAKFEAWDSEKERYELNEIYPGGFAYVLKKTEEVREKPHSICVYCYQNRHKSILLRSRNPDGKAVVKCFACNAEVRLHSSDLESKSRPRPDRVCPYCDDQMRLLEEYDHPGLGSIGVKVLRLKCRNPDCAKEVTRDFRPSKSDR